MHWHKFSLKSVSKSFTKDEHSIISLNGTAYNFSVDHRSIEKHGILNVHKYLVVKNNIK